MIPNLYIGEREENRGGFAGFESSTYTSTNDRALWLWRSPPKNLAIHMISCGCKISGCWLYFPNDYQGWHTNGDILGQRIYFSWASESNKSGMRFYIDGKIIDSPDKEGWNRRIFTPPIWHSVYSNCIRASVGFLSTQNHYVDSLQPETSDNVEDLFPIA